MVVLTMKPREYRRIRMLIRVGVANSVPALIRELNADPTYRRYMRKKRTFNEEGD